MSATQQAHYPIALLALDLDGTVVRESMAVDPVVMDLLSKLISQQVVRVVVATGRMHPSAKLYADRLGIVEPVISYQGGMICAQDAAQTQLLHQPIPFSVARRLLAFLDAEGFHTNTYVNNVLYTHATNPFLDLYRTLSGLEPTLIEDWSQIPQHSPIHSSPTQAIPVQGPTKLMVINEERMPVLMAGLKEHFNTEVTYFLSRSNFCEIIAPTVSKWSAVWWLAQQWGLSPNVIMACGDQENDAAMIEQAGVGVAMGNAPAHIKALANRIAPHVDAEGLVPLLRELLETGGVTASTVRGEGVAE
ncbi:MAG: Cof-type HAD-IIB family hydrolase [Vampirovibrionales bacterium]